MKKLFFAAALLASSNAQAESLWVAEARAIAVTEKCAGSVAIGDYFRAIYRPKGTAIGNGADSNLALFSPRTGFWMRVPNNTFQSKINYVGVYYGSRTDSTSTSGGILDWTESAAFGSPRSSNVTASFANTFAAQGCTATFRMPFVPLP